MIEVVKYRVAAKLRACNLKDFKCIIDTIYSSRPNKGLSITGSISGHFLSNLVRTRARDARDAFGRSGTMSGVSPPSFRP